VRTIYVAAVEPTITYAAAAWAGAADKLGTQRELAAVQRGFVQKLCGAYRTVSLNSALALTGMLPLDLRIHEAAALYKARRGTSGALPDDREMEMPVGPTETLHPARCVAMSFTALGDQEAVDRHTVQAVQIYTDGSKIDGRVGASLSIWTGGAETKAVKLCLAAYCTVYQAELLAIHRATCEILKRGDASFGICSDSRSALETVVSQGSHHRLAFEARENIRRALEQGKDVSLFWIKAHAGLPGNERADQLAKEAASLSRRKSDYDLCPVSFAKRHIRADTLCEWDRRYTSGTTASVTKMFFPDVFTAYRLSRKIRAIGVLTQVLTGHGGFAQYLNRFKCRASSSCICDPECEETVPHILFVCPANESDRYEYERKMDAKIERDCMVELIESKKTRELFLEYCKKVASKSIKRNK
jgi:ribonuclease HI